MLAEAAEEEDESEGGSMDVLSSGMECGLMGEGRGREVWGEGGGGWSLMLWRSRSDILVLELSREAEAVRFRIDQAQGFQNILLLPRRVKLKSAGLFSSLVQECGKITLAPAAGRRSHSAQRTSPDAVVYASILVCRSSMKSTLSIAERDIKE